MKLKKKIQCSFCDILTPHKCIKNSDGKIEFKGWYVNGELVKKLPANIPLETKTITTNLMEISNDTKE